MKKFRMNLSIDAWIKDVYIEAENEEEAYNKLYEKGLEEIVNEGYVKDFAINQSSDAELVEADFKYLVKNIRWEEPNEKLPFETIVEIHWEEDKDCETELIDEYLQDKFDAEPKSYIYSEIEENEK